MYSIISKLLESTIALATMTTDPNQDSQTESQALTSAFSNWQALPDELKAMILRQRLVLTRPMTSDNADSHTNRVLLPLALTSKAMNGLACEVFYKENTFVAKQTIPFRSHSRLLRFLNPACGDLVRTLEVYLPIHTCFRTLQPMLESKYGSRHLLRFDDDALAAQLQDKTSFNKNLQHDTAEYWMEHFTDQNPWTPESTNRQDAFPSLQSLKIVFTSESPDTTSCVFCCIVMERGAANFATGFGQRLAPSHARIDIRAKNVELTVRELDRGSAIGQHHNCRD